MQVFRFSIRGAVKHFAIAVLVGVLWLTSSLVAPVYAESLSSPNRYIAADGTDLTAMAQCLPRQLNQGNLSRALKEAQNDFLEKVFDVKDNYSDYKLDANEIEYLACLEGKGITPQVKR